MPRVARNTPVLKSNVVDTREEQVGQDRVATMASTGPAKIEESEILVVDRPPPSAKLEELAFMEEIVEVEVAPSNDPQSEQFTEVGNGGRSFVFPHGHIVKCQRKFVEVLARSKRRTFKNEEYEEGGVKGVRWPSSQASAHQFQVHNDTPKGREWLKRILKEAI